MTAVIGILNKRGVAIAADSAVTRGRTNESKCTKNGNKMIRLSNVVPICLMMTGNADFLETPWEVIARCYRQKRGLINHPTVESCVNDFFIYISDNQVFWNLALTSQWIKDVLDSIYNEFADEHNEFITAYHIHGNYTTEEVKKFECSIIEICDMLRNKWLNNGVWPQFNDYTQEQFSIYSKSVFDEFFGSISFSILPREIIDKLRSEIELTVMTQLITIKDNNYTQLIFTGYGEDQEFPSLVPVIVNGGFDQKIKY